jgi:hypothetical protein
MSWQTTSIQAAATFLRERMAAGDHSPRTKAIYDGLLEVLDPARRTLRVQRELATVTKLAAAAAMKTERDRRAAERRRAADRRKVNLGSTTGVERRQGERRTPADRRNRA